MQETTLTRLYQPDHAAQVRALTVLVQHLMQVEEQAVSREQMLVHSSETLSPGRCHAQPEHQKDAGGDVPAG